MNPQSAASAGSADPLKFHSYSETRAKRFSQSADPLAYSPSPLPPPLIGKMPDGLILELDIQIDNVWGNHTYLL